MCHKTISSNVNIVKSTNLLYNSEYLMTWRISMLDMNDKEKRYAALYEKYYSDVLDHTMYISRDMNIAEDCTQDAFVKFISLSGDHPNPLGWLKKVASNYIYSYYRRQKIKDKKFAGIGNDIIVNPEDTAISKLETAKVRHILNKMNPRDSMCILLRYSDYKYSEIAELMGIQPSTVGKMLLRAQNRFKELYLEEEK